MINYGIEYEFEDVYNLDQDDWGHIGPLPPSLRDNWQAVRDGTLRGDGGVEFVFLRKLPIQKASEAVSSLLAVAERGNYSRSIRCSTHIHLDTTGLKRPGRIAFGLLLIANDREFFRMGGDRSNSNYCCPVYGTPIAVGATNKLCCAPRWSSEGRGGMPAVRNIHDGDLKYSSVNMEPLYSQGTIELRHFKPVMDKDVMDDILRLAELLYNTAYTIPARGMGSIPDVLERYGRMYGKQEQVDWVLDMYSTHNSMV